MKILSLDLEQFRNYEKKSFKVDDPLTIICGPNGSGKTNVLEAIELLSVARSPRVSREEELIRISSNYARVSATLDSKEHLEVVLSRKPDSTRIVKTCKVNGAQKTGPRFIGILPTVYFSPEDIRLVAGSPSRRREHLDRMLSQVDREYHSALSTYTRILKQRNKLLERLRGQILRAIDEPQLSFWNDKLVETGQVVQTKRADFFTYANEKYPDISKTLFPYGDVVRLTYRQSTLTKEKLQSMRHQELVRGATQIGPHRDDFDFLSDQFAGRSLKGYGSRGQQRTAVLCLKVLELDFLRNHSKTNPILLLDDIFSELDETYRSHITTIAKNQQTIITTADFESIPETMKSTANMIQLNDT